MPSWSDIPLELAGLVLRLLPTYADRARFAAVCPQWRAAARQHPVPPPLPLLALPDGTFYSLPCTQPFRFPGCGFAGFNSACRGYLVFPQDDICFLVNPFSRATVMLPALSSVRLCPPNADLKNVPVEPSTSTWLHIKDKNLCFRKLLLCSLNLVAAFINHGVTGQILVCQPGGPSLRTSKCVYACPMRERSTIAPWPERAGHGKKRKTPRGEKRQAPFHQVTYPHFPSHFPNLRSQIPNAGSRWRRRRLEEKELCAARRRMRGHRQRWRSEQKGSGRSRWWKAMVDMCSGRRPPTDMGASSGGCRRRCKEGAAGSGRLWSREAAIVRSWDESGEGGGGMEKTRKLGFFFTAPPPSFPCCHSEQKT